MKNGENVMKLEKDQAVGIFTSRNEIVLKKVKDGYTQDDARKLLDKMIALSKSHKIKINDYAIVLGDYDYTTSDNARKEIASRLRKIDDYDVYISQKWVRTKTGRAFPAYRVVITTADDHGDKSETISAARLA